MTESVGSAVLGSVFAFLHIAVVTITLKYIKKIPPVFIHAVSAFVHLILLYLVSLAIATPVWIAASILAFCASFFLFIFGALYKSLTLRILYCVGVRGGDLTIDQIDEAVTIPTFAGRAALLSSMGHTTLREEDYSLTRKGEKMAGILHGIRKFFHINTKAVYQSNPKKSFRERLANLCLRSGPIIFIVYSLFVLLYISGLHQKLYISADNRIKFHAIPVAISTLYQGHKHDYRGWLSTERPFQNNDLLTDSFIDQQIQAPVNKEVGHYYWVADDRGYADYVIAAFALFGPHMKSLYQFWFVILFVSITLFTLSFGRQIWAMAYLALLLLGIHSAMSLLKCIHVAVPIFEPRYLDVLALVPVMHLIFTSVFLDRRDWNKNWGFFIGQLLIFIFLYHARSSLGWEIVAIVMVSLFLILAHRVWHKIYAPLLVIIFTMGSVGLLSGYKRLVYHKSYFQNMGARTFWHNALMGMNIQAMPTKVCDYTIAELVIQYAKNSGCNSHIAKLSAQELLNTLGNWGVANWLEYEDCAKKFYLSQLWQNKWEVMQLYLIFKPLQVLQETMFPKVILFSGEVRKPSRGHVMPWQPFHLLYLAPFCLILVVGGQSLYSVRWKLFIITSAIFVFGMIPPVAFYSDILTHGGMSVAMVVMCYLGIMVGLFRLMKKYSYRLSGL